MGQFIDNDGKAGGYWDGNIWRNANNERVAHRDGNKVINNDNEVIGSFDGDTFRNADNEVVYRMDGNRY